MADNETYETCSISRCMSAALHSEYAQVGHWFVTIFYCDEHYRELNAGTPLGPIGIDPSKIRIESYDDQEMPNPTASRFPGID
jgi:hypothetical protein